MTDTLDHPLIRAMDPLLSAIGGRVVLPNELSPGDIPIAWENEVIGGVRVDSLSTALARMVDQIEAELGSNLANLGRVEKQAAVRMLDERGAFMLRRAIEDVAVMMEVSRITIYNYLNAIRKD